jgi:hypothetical protein
VDGDVPVLPATVIFRQVASALVWRLADLHKLALEQGDVRHPVPLMQGLQCQLGNPDKPARS